MIDSSAVVELLTADRSSPVAHDLRSRIEEANGVHAPFLIDTEVQSAIRGLAMGRRISFERAQVALARFGDLPVLRYSAEPLALAVWDLRDVLTTYDATYVALAEVLGCPLVTCDRKLAKVAPGLVETF